MPKRGTYNGGSSIVRAHPIGYGEPSKAARVGFLTEAVESWDPSKATATVRRRKDVEAEKKEKLARERLRKRNLRAAQKANAKTRKKLKSAKIRTGKTGFTAQRMR